MDYSTEQTQRARRPSSGFLGGLAGVLIKVASLALTTGCAIPPSSSYGGSADYDERRMKDEGDLSLESANESIAAVNRTLSLSAKTTKDRNQCLAAANLGNANAAFIAAERQKRWRQEERDREATEARRHAEMMQKIEETNRSRTEERSYDAQRSNGNQRNIEPAQEVPDFFTCSYRKDFDGDGLASDNEYVGLTKRAKKGENFCIVGKIHNEPGQTYELKIFGPDGKEFKSVSERLLTANRVVGADDGNWAKDLLKDGKSGVYVAAWYLDGKFKGSSQFEIYENPNTRIPENKTVSPVTQNRDSPSVRDSAKDRALAKSIVEAELKVAKMEKQYLEKPDESLMNEINLYKKAIENIREKLNSGN